MAVEMPPTIKMQMAAKWMDVHCIDLGGICQKGFKVLVFWGCVSLLLDSIWGMLAFGAQCRSKHRPRITAPLPPKTTSTFSQMVKHNLQVKRFNIMFWIGNYGTKVWAFGELKMRFRLCGFATQPGPVC